MTQARGIYWLSSYPKSGNTWFRIFLANLLYADDSPMDINLVEYLINDQMTTSRQWVDKACGFDSALLTHDELDELKPTLYSAYGLAHPVSYHKLHKAYTYLDNGTPLIPAEGCLGAIYFIRNPLDVAISLANHFLCSIDDAIDIMSNHDFALYPLRQKFLSWSKHVASWVEAKHVNVCMLRYEDMVFEPQASFTKAVEFLALDVTKEKISQAISNSEFNKLKQVEEDVGFFEKPPRLERFFRKGIVGDWKNALNDEQIERVIEEHGKMMQRFGYLDEAKSPL